MGTIAEVVRTAQRQGDVRPDVDPEQFAWEFHAITLAYHYFSRLIRDPEAEVRLENPSRI